MARLLGLFLLFVSHLYSLSACHANDGLVNFMQMVPEIEEDLVDHKRSTVLYVWHEGALAGYIVITEIPEFSTFYQTRDFEYLLADKGMQYIEQIAIKRELVNGEIGRSLMERAKRVSPHGLVSVVTVDKTALEFFQNNGFESAGNLNSYPVLLWQGTN